MSIWDKVLGVVGGPALTIGEIAAGDEANKDARTTGISLFGGLGGTAGQYAAADNANDQNQAMEGIKEDMIFGSAAATAATLGAAAPAAAAATTALEPTASVAAPIATTAATTAAPALGTAGTAALPASTSLLPAVAPATEVGLGSAVPTIAAPIAAAPGSSVVPASETVINEVTGEIPKNALLSNIGKGVKLAGNGFSIAKDNSEAATKRTQEESAPTPLNTTKLIQAPQPLDITSHNHFQTIFGTPDNDADPMGNNLNSMLNPNLNFNPMPIKPIEPVIAPKPTFNLQDFTNQINGRV